VFVGPTLAAADARGVLDAVYLPPARQGDVYRAVLRDHPRAIGLVDGYFQDVPSVWHKEILWAMARDTQVFGSASMGALRAAELAELGMRGVGRIFEAYQRGRMSPYTDEPFEDDDEVAVLHGPREQGFRALSEAMVNVRATLAAATDAGVIAPATRDALAGVAKRLFYADRAYERILAAGNGAVPVSELEALRAWLPTGRVDQKREDALAMLAAMRAWLAGDPRPAPLPYVFEPTDMWLRAAESFVAAPPEDGPPAADLVLDEVRLEGPAYAEARRAALLRLLAGVDAARARPAPGEEACRRSREALRRRFGLTDRAALEAWLRASDLDGAGWARLVQDEARLEELGSRYERSLGPYVLDHLRVTGAYGRYAARARAKQAILEASGGEPPELDDWARSQLTAWYFERTGLGLVSEDVVAHAVRAGFPDLDAFYRALRREFAYVHRARRGAPPNGAPPPAAPEPGR
jgi:hypothetical protein